ncbi:MAG: hypothetical protein AAF927_20710 [Bacteroidota bacterium]
MQLRNLLLCSLALFCACQSPSHKQQSNAPQNKPATPNVLTSFQPVAERMRESEYFYRILQNDIEAGAMRVSVFREPDSWLVEEHSTLDLAGIEEIIRTRLSQNTLSPVAHEVRGKIGENQLDVTIKWVGQNVQGHSQFPRPDHKRQGRLLVDAKLPAGTQERTAAFHLLHTLELEEGTEIKFPWFNGLYAQLDNIHLKVTGTVIKTVPAGTFECLRVELIGGDPSQIVFLSKERPRKIISIEVFDLPWKFELL